MNLIEGNNALNITMTTVVKIATLEGVVSDSLGPLQGVLVAISGIASTITDASGYYAFSNLTPGTYTITFSIYGYNTITR